MKRTLNRSRYIMAAIGASAFLLSSAGCDSGNLKTAASLTSPAEVLPQYGDAANASVEFERPYRLKTSDGKFVTVDSPGYACPTLADVDGDGDEDLVVGQFHNGCMQLYRNEAGEGSIPKFGYLEWISNGETKAEVPGIS